MRIASTLIRMVSWPTPRSPPPSRPHGQARRACPAEQVFVKLLQAAVVGHDGIAVLRAERDRRAPTDADVVDPDDEVHEALPPARPDLLDPADAAADLGVLQRLAGQQARIPPAELIAHPVPEAAVGV